MAALLPHAFNEKVTPILGSIRSTGVPSAHVPAAPPRVLPFITISRQAGAGGHSLAEVLVKRLNEEVAGDDRHWQSFDRELVEKVAADHHISTQLIDSLEDSSHSWLTEFFTGMSMRDDASPSEMKVFHKVCATVRALAQAGRVVLVGCGAGFISTGMPGGVHVRLVAPFERRVAMMGRLMNISLDAAATEVRRRDWNRQAFFARYWPGRPLNAEQFTMTLNSAQMSEEQMVTAVMGMVRNETGALRRQVVAPG